MGSVFLFVLLIFNVCLVIPFVTCKNNCGANDYTIIDAHGAFIRCLTCATCHPGLGLDPLCGSSIQDPPDNIKCVRCKAGTFSSQYDSSPCYACHQCAEQELITKPCSDKSNTVCSGKCKKGYFFRKMTHHDCQKCCKCVMDGKDEKITECVDQGLSEHCSARPDKECESSETAHASKGGGLSTTTVSVIGVIGAVVVIALVILALYLNHRRKKRNRELSQQAEAPADHQLNDITPSQAYASKGPTTESSIRSQVRFSEPPLNPTYQGTPCGSQDQLEVKESVPFHATKHDVSQLPSDSVQKTAAVSTKSTGKRVELPEEKERKKPSLGRQGSQDSQTSGDGEAKLRKRSGSALSFAETIKRKFSDRDDSLIEEDPDVDDSHEPIKIVTHPKSQTAKEGSKVELKCKVEGNSTNLLYQWYKDDCAVIGQNNANLVLEAVELKDFGRYTCRVSYRDSYGEGENSSPAILDVIPQNLNATRPKLLTELDIETRDEVASLLENKRFGLGGCRQVAAKYGMKNHQIGALDNSKQPGQDVMEFLEGKKPNLTVYSFCKTLKENNIERFDIVKILENHFLKREGTNEYV